MPHERCCGALTEAVVQPSIDAPFWNKSERLTRTSVPMKSPSLASAFVTQAIAFSSSTTPSYGIITTHLLLSPTYCVAGVADSFLGSAKALAIICEANCFGHGLRSAGGGQQPLCG